MDLQKKLFVGGRFELLRDLWCATDNERTAVVVASSVADANPRMRLCMGRFTPERATAQYDSTHLTSQTRTVDLWSGYRTSEKKHFELTHDLLAGASCP